MAGQLYGARQPARGPCALAVKKKLQFYYKKVFAMQPCTLSHIPSMLFGQCLPSSPTESRHWPAKPEVVSTIWSLYKLSRIIRSSVYACGQSVRSITHAQVGRVQEIAGAQELRV